jgi:cytochrome c-type biogenesis protein CcmE
MQDREQPGTDSPSASGPREEPAERERRGMAPGLKIALIVGFLGGAVALLLFGSSASDAFVYSKLVNEVMTSPQSFKGRELRVEGELKAGSIQFREDPCEYRFVIEKAGKEMPVHFPQCVVPDTFRDGMGISVTVQGKLTPEGGFVANQVVPRCPSKYEMQQKKKNGEVMPHAQPVAAQGAGPVN